MKKGLALSSILGTQYFLSTANQLVAMDGLNSLRLLRAELARQAEAEAVKALAVINNSVLLVPRFKGYFNSHLSATGQTQ
jgi:hypothetical protein